MLIKCPECNKEVSDKAECCIHCGYPLQKINDSNICQIDGIEYDLSDELKKFKEDMHIVIVASLIKNKIPIDLYNAIELCKEIQNNGFVVPKKYHSKPNPNKYKEPEITCPRCGSTQITTGPRGVNGFWGFIGASKTVNRCGSCGKTWSPKG